MGFSLGGISINNVMIPWRLRASKGLDFKVAIAMYGHCLNVGSYPEGSIPLMEIVGDKDTNFVETCRNIGIDKAIEVHVLTGTHHSFDSQEASGMTDMVGNYMQYSSSATNNARELTKQFLAKHLAR